MPVEKDASFGNDSLSREKTRNCQRCHRFTRTGVPYYSEELALADTYIEVLQDLSETALLCRESEAEVFDLKYAGIFHLSTPPLLVLTLMPSEIK